MELTLRSFGPDLSVAILGASGGIGLAFAELLGGHPQVAKIMRISRPEFDLLDPATIVAAAREVGGELDIVIVATGMLHDTSGGPERSLRELDAGRLAHSFAINAIGPALVAQAFLPLLRTDRKTAFAALSARVGSIADNRLGGWYGYRASKAALNQLIRTAAIEHARRNPLGLCVALHPGTVDTGLSKPFQRGVAPGKLFDPAFAAAAMLGVLDRLAASDSGGLFAWDGAAIPF